MRKNILFKKCTYPCPDRSFFTLLKQIIALLIAACLLSACTYYANPPRAEVLTDEIKKLTRVNQSLYFNRSVERRSGLISLHQTISKEVKNNVVSYEMYDVLSLNRSSFPLEDSVFVVVNGTATALPIEYQANESRSSVSESRKDVMQADSSKVSVVTGYSESQWTNVKIRYTLPNALASQINTDHNVRFRYYAGPRMITVALEYAHLRAWEKLHQLPE